MKIKFCIAKLIDTQPVYMTDTVGTWVSDIGDPTVRWYDRETDAMDAVETPLLYVVPKEYIDAEVQLEALTRACEALAEAERVGAIDCPTTVYIKQELFDTVVRTVTRDNSSDGFVSRHGYFNGVDVCDARYVK